MDKNANILKELQSMLIGVRDLAQIILTKQEEEIKNAEEKLKGLCDLALRLEDNNKLIIENSPNEELTKAQLEELKELLNGQQK